MQHHLSQMPPPKDDAVVWPADPLGLRQSGLPDFVFADPFAHRDLLATAGDDARLIIARDPALTSPRGLALRVLQELFDWKEGLGRRGAG